MSRQGYYKTMENKEGNVKFKLFGILRLNYRPSEGEVPVKGSITLTQLLKELADRYPGIQEKLLEDEKLRPGVVLLVNGKNVLHLEELATQIKPGDTVVIFPPGAGG
ncbi:ubiquitin-like small modifier protein 1 [Thermodesulfatator indicus]|nr:ubiquitin-like small modifier protein 1 [Thermodesulfatator indicus]